MIIVTGGAGFIGSNLIKGLNERGQTEIIVVDNLTNAEKIKNLQGLQFADYLDKEDFLERIIQGHTFGKLQAVLHEGACSDTMATDGRYVMHNNYEYSKQLYHYCGQYDAQFIYASSASVYGAGSIFIESPEHEHALNVYAYSKLLFDNYVRRQSAPNFQVTGLRYFNVYGEREQHKLRMASVAWHFFHQYREQQRLGLFAGSDGYGNGAQVRDFISVEDVVKVNLFLLDHPEINGIYNIGTGQSHSFNDVALAVINSLRRQNKENSVTLEQAVNNKLIHYFPMPDALLGKYQSYTQADIARLRQSGYTEDFYSVELGIDRYMQRLAA